MSSLRRPSRPVVLVAALGVVVLVLVVLLVGRSGDDGPELRIVRGAPSAGFPLRGDLARDEGALRAAAAEWLEEDREEEDDDVFSDHTDEFEITALWAGRVGDDRAVILAHERTAALVVADHEHGGEPQWSLNRTLPIAHAEAPTIVPFEGAILVADDAKGVFRTAGRRGATEQDGLWRANGRSGVSSPGEGVLVLPNGLTHRRFGSGKQPPAIVVTGEDSAVRTVDTGLADRLVRDPLSFDGPALQRFVAAARGSSGDDEARRAPSLDGPAKVEIVHDGPLEGIGPTTVVSVGADEATGGVRPSVVAAVGGSDVAGAEGAERIELRVEDEQNARDGLRASRGPAMGAAYVRREPDAPDDGTGGAADDELGEDGSPGGAGATGTDDPDDEAGAAPGPPLLLLAADRSVRSFELLAGERRITRPGPVAVVPAPWKAPGRTRPYDRTTDVVLFGRTAGGAVVRPGAVSGTVHEIDQD